jgi:hypothetical protein
MIFVQIDETANILLLGALVVAARTELLLEINTENAF